MLSDEKLGSLQINRKRKKFFKVNCHTKISMKNYKPFISPSGYNIAAIFVGVAIVNAIMLLVSN